MDERNSLKKTYTSRFFRALRESLSAVAGAPRAPKTVDRRELAALQDQRAALQVELGDIKKSLKASARTPTSADGYIIKTGQAPLPPDAGLWLPLAYVLPATSPSWRTVPVDEPRPSGGAGGAYVYVATAPDADTYVVDYVAKFVIDDQYTLLQQAERLLRRLLRGVSRAIRDFIKILASPDHPHGVVNRERRWHLLHGSHPPDLKVHDSRVVPQLLFRVGSKMSGAVAA